MDAFDNPFRNELFIQKWGRIIQQNCTETETDVNTVH